MFFDMSGGEEAVIPKQKEQEMKDSVWRKIFRRIVHEIIPTHGTSKKEKEEYYEEWREYFQKKQDDEEFLAQVTRERDIRDFGSATYTMDRAASNKQESLIDRLLEVIANAAGAGLPEIEQEDFSSSSSAPATTSIGRGRILQPNRQPNPVQTTAVQTTAVQTTPFANTVTPNDTEVEEDLTRTEPVSIGIGSSPTN